MLAPACYMPPFCWSSLSKLTHSVLKAIAETLQRRSSHDTALVWLPEPGQLSNHSHPYSVSFFLAWGQVSAPALSFDRARIEGLALACLCSLNDAVRVAALEALGAASVLDKALRASRARSSGAPAPCSFQCISL